MKSKTNIISHKKFIYDFNNNNFPNQKPKVKTQAPNNNKFSNKTSTIIPTIQQPNKNKTQFPPINSVANKFSNVQNEINNPFYKSPGKGKPKTEIEINRMDIDNEYDKRDKNTGKTKTPIKHDKINVDNSVVKKAGKAPTTIINNKMKIEHEKEKNIPKPKTEIKSNKINIGTIPKINQNKNQNQSEKESEVNNSYINSINDVRLPKELDDISFDTYKAE